MFVSNRLSSLKFEMESRRDLSLRRGSDGLSRRGFVRYWSLIHL
jgi:hypothetical protein